MVLCTVSTSALALSEGFVGGFDGAQIALGLLFALGFSGEIVVVQDAVDGVLVEDADAPVGGHVHLEGFELDALPAGLVLDGEGPEVGQPGLGADRVVFGVDDGDGRVRELAGPGLNPRQLRR